VIERVTFQFSTAVYACMAKNSGRQRATSDLFGENVLSVWVEFFGLAGALSLVQQSCPCSVRLESFW